MVDWVTVQRQHGSWGREPPHFRIRQPVDAGVGVSRTAMTLLIKSGLLCSPQIVDSPRAVSSTSTVQ